jgi:rubredoxin
MADEVCDVCGSTNIKEIKCKVICQNCGTILRSCADLVERLRTNQSLRTAD